MAVQEPPVNVREKGDRVVLVFGVANAKHNSIKVNYEPAGSDDAGAILVTFDAVSPARKYAKRLVLPGVVVQARTTTEAQSKNVTVQLVKADAGVEWGQAWLKPPKKGGAKGKARPPVSSSPTASPAIEPAKSPSATPDLGPTLDGAEAPSPVLVSTAPPTELDGMEDDGPLEPEASPSPAGQAEEKEARSKEGEGDHIANQQGTEEAAPVVDDKPAGGAQKSAQAQVEKPKHAGQAKSKNKKKDNSPEPIAPSPTVRPAEHAAAPAAEHVGAGNPATEKDKETHAGVTSAAEGKKSKSAARRARSSRAKAKTNGTAEDIDSVLQEFSEPDPVITEPGAPQKVGTAGGRKKSRGPASGRGLSPKPSSNAPADKAAALLQGKDGMALLPPSDPEIQKLVQEGTTQFAKDPKKAAIFLRLAARKGYLPALLLLAQLAQESGNESMMIDALCSVLTSEAASKHLVPELLSQCAMQLAAILRDPKHASELEMRKSELEAVASSYPILNVALVAAASNPKQNAAGSSSSNRSAPPKGSSVGTDDKRPATSVGDGKDPENLARLPPKLRERLLQRGILKPEELNSVGDGDVKTTLESGVSPSSSSASCKGVWQDVEGGDGWVLTVEVPQLASLADGSLEISAEAVQLRAMDGQVLVREAMPKGADSDTAQAKWSQRKRCLTVKVPKLPESVLAERAAEERRKKQQQEDAQRRLRIKEQEEADRRRKLEMEEAERRRHLAEEEERKKKRLLSSPKVAQVLQDHPELNENPTALLDHLEGQGLIENIFASLESVLQQQQRWPAAPAVSLEGAAPPVQARPEPHTTATAAAYPAYGVGCETSGGSSSSTAPSPLWHLGLRLVEGRSFLDYLDEADSAGRELQWHVSFGGQRFRSRVVPSAVDPYFDATFSLALPQVRSRAALLTHAAPMHLVLVCRGGPGCREDPWDAGEVTLLCSHYLEWRNCLAAVGPYKLTIELRGVGRRKQLSVGVLHAEVELRGAGAASTSALLTEQAVGTQIRGEEQRRANVMRRVFEDLDRWWAQYHELFASRYVCLFAQTESCLFLPVTSFVTPLEAGRSLDSPGHALRWVSLMGTDPRPALESAEPRWHTIPALWAQGRGTVEEKTLMLCSLLLGFSLDAWCCLGTDTRGQPHAWVIVRSKGDASKPADVMCWDVRAAAKIACNSAQFLAAYSSVDAAFNHRRMLVCHADSAARVSFDFGDPKVWLGVPLDGQDVDALRLYPALSCPPFADLRPQIWNPPFQACDIEEAIEQRLENALKAHREAVGLQTTFDRHLAQLLHIALVNCEHERAGIASADASLFEEIVKGVCAQGEVFRAVPVQFNHLKLSLFWPTLSDRQAVREALALSAGPPLFALRARVVVFPEGAVAAWVLLAVRCRSS